MKFFPSQVAAHLTRSVPGRPVARTFSSRIVERLSLGRQQRYAKCNFALRPALRRTFAYLFWLLLGLTAPAFRPAADAYAVLPKASRLAWTGHAEVGSYAPSGTLQLRRGAFAYDGRRLRQGYFEVDMTSLRHDNAQLQEHLRGADFFDVARFPTAELRLRAAAPGQAQGQLTIRGVVQPVTLPVQLTRLPDGQLRAQGTLRLDRTRFGIRYGSASFFAGLGDRAIRHDFELSFDVLAAPAAGN